MAKNQDTIKAGFDGVVTFTCYGIEHSVTYKEPSASNILYFSEVEDFEAAKEFDDAMKFMRKWSSACHLVTQDGSVITSLEDFEAKRFRDFPVGFNQFLYGTVYPFFNRVRDNPKA